VGASLWVSGLALLAGFGLELLRRALMYGPRDATERVGSQ
jgi:hypothetical protein